ncbi:MAG TPA: alpha-amylase family glycosyl hydrolase [Anaerolineales bacterium]|nr:alpha-amylase family glycosyl hydrolase [Anaerolineales bacterium]
MKPVFEFHVSRRARQKYEFDETLFATDGRLVLSDFSAARRFTERIYAVSGRLIPASDIYALGLMDEVLHLIIRHYEKQNPGVMARAMDALQSTLGHRLIETLFKFTDEFPPVAVFHGKRTVEEYLAGSTNGISHGQVSMEEMLLLNIVNNNPAAQSYRELFDDSALSQTAYLHSISLLANFFAKQPPMPGRGKGETLVEILTAPSKASPYSLEGQLQFLLDQWGDLLGEDLIRRILRAIDFVREEVMRQHGIGEFHPTAEVPTYKGYPEYERYSADQDWMPRLVLIAKNSYVWLEQLSRKYLRWIKTLDQVPDEELDILRDRGFTGLWLIGLWERSRASQRIKQRMGDQDAVASAYSLDSYDIASDLGGWDALSNLRARAWQRGIRLSADMVPNHMGIDSQWVIQHPDWFLSLPYPPFPSYSFNSENLSDDERVRVTIEDHYYSKTDASVVFKRFDRATGDVRYIYHGNDGTSFPWNDTAQLDYSKAEVREAIIQTILHVAHNFPIIRFDAAMTLAKKHIQRLWFPEPGSGGAIPSRAEHGLSRSEFDAAIPQEFWREVVDRVAAEVPDTLLLAEAFWLLEGYFVRTLGMHRVYNSAFMHMLRDEDNAKYRLAIKNTLEFDPQILKRYVNFMNNPDEKTAVEQFGNGDKYFGVATLLSTLPGLPMFGHGQVEGFREKYGMEFRKPKWDETPDEGLIRGHDWKIFPLLHRRSLFADVEHFLLYDLFSASGVVDENVFAYSNRHGDERGLIIYHNKFADTRGWIRMSAAYLDKSSGHLLQKSLGEGLGLPSHGYVIFTDYVTHLEYIRSCSELWEKGLYVELSAYQHHAFMEWRFVDGSDWGILTRALNGVAVESVRARFAEMFARKEDVVTVVEEVRAKKPRKKEAAKKAAEKKSVKSKAKKTVTQKKSVKSKAKKTVTQKNPSNRTASHKARSPSKSRKKKIA